MIAQRCALIASHRQPPTALHMVPYRIIWGLCMRMRSIQLYPRGCASRQAWGTCQKTVQRRAGALDTSLCHASHMYTDRGSSRSLLMDFPGSVGCQGMSSKKGPDWSASSAPAPASQSDITRGPDCTCTTWRSSAANQRRSECRAHSRVSVPHRERVPAILPMVVDRMQLALAADKRVMRRFGAVRPSSFTEPIQS